MLIETLNSRAGSDISTNTLAEVFENKVTF